MLEPSLSLDTVAESLSCNTCWATHVLIAAVGTATDQSCQGNNTEWGAKCDVSEPAQWRGSKRMRLGPSLFQCKWCICRAQNPITIPLCYGCCNCTVLPWIRTNTHQKGNTQWSFDKQAARHCLPELREAPKVRTTSVLHIVNSTRQAQIDNPMMAQRSGNHSVKFATYRLWHPLANHFPLHEHQVEKWGVPGQV